MLPRTFPHFFSACPLLLLSLWPRPPPSHLRESCLLFCSTGGRVKEAWPRACVRACVRVRGVGLWVLVRKGSSRGARGVRTGLPGEQLRERAEAAPADTHARTCACTLCDGKRTQSISRERDRCERAEPRRACCLGTHTYTNMVKNIVGHVGGRLAFLLSLNLWEIFRNATTRMSRSTFTSLTKRRRPSRAKSRSAGELLPPLHAPTSVFLLFEGRWWLVKKII